MNDLTLDRRRFLEAGVAGAATLGMGALHASPARAARRTRRVILVAFSGGVRTKETLRSAGNVPNMARMAEEGVTYSRARTSNLGHFGATLSLFTGTAEARGIRENTRGDDPTLFEYVRKDLALDGADVWVATSGGAQQANYSHGLHPEYGAAYGANALDGDGLFNAEFRGIVEAYGKPREMEAREKELFESMRDSIGSGEGASVNTPKSSAAVERYILEELTSGTTDLRGVGAADAKALRVARNLLAIFKPTLLGVVLQNADVAHGSFNSYVEVVRRNDAMLGELWDTVRGDEELADSTAIFVLPEFGRDADLNYVSLVCWGPDFRRGANVLDEVRTIDVCPTACDLLGARARYARGRGLPRLLS